MLIFTMIAASWPSLSNYLQLDFSLNFLWILLLPFIIHIKDPQKISLRYIWLVLLSAIFYIFIPSYFFLYLLLWFGILLVLETRHGKLNSLALLVVVVTTPIFKYFFDLFGIPIRRFLTEASAMLISIPYPDTYAMGNAISFQGEMFMVDPACAGLKLVITSILLTMFFIAMKERQTKSSFTLFQFGFIFFAALMMILFSNMSRIVVLTVFKVSADSAWHDLIGMLCLIIFTLLPMYKLIQRMEPDRTKDNMHKYKKTYQSKYSLLSSVSVIVIIVSMNYFTPVIEDQSPDQYLIDLSISGFEKKMLANNTVSFSNDHQLVYYKPCKGVFRSEHHPSICWRGSGYTFTNDQVIEIDGEDVNVSELQFDGTKLYTAWWYENENDRTCDQITWRINTLFGGSPYRMVNCTSTDMPQLINLIGSLKAKKKIGSRILRNNKQEIINKKF
ncbi:MAG: exosortase N [Bacteroidia bacterium]|nr:exosortase N [Bacteroidia bacterium]